MSKGLGRMLLSGRVEQYRELLWCGRVPHDETADRSCALSTAGCLTRTYRVMIKGKPTMMITEWFEPGGSLAGS